jgi:hypothetical protein
MGVVTVLSRRVLRAARLLAALAAGVVVLLCVVASAHGELLKPGSFSVTTTSNQAGAHPDITTSFAFVANGEGVVSEHQKDVVVDLPPGLIGEPAAVPQCALATFQSDIAGGNESCPADTIVGSATVVLTLIPGLTLTEQIPLDSIVPDAGQVAAFAFSVFGLYGIQVVASVRPGDFGVRTTVRNTSSLLDLDAVSLTLWGVPAASSHDPQRGEWCTSFNGSEPSCFNGGLSVAGNPAPFLTNPTQCGVPLAASLHADSWENRATFNHDGSPNLSDPTWKSQSSQLPAITGCEHLSFQPTLSVQPTETQADTPTGLVVDLKLPQDNDPEVLATAELRKSVVTLPAGLTLSPSAADGLQACSDAQVGLNNNDPPGCPLASKIGTATLRTPALPDQLAGSIYLAGPESGPITGPPYRLFLTLEGDGVLIKLQGTVTVDPATGQLTTTFDNNPQQPFSELRLEFKDGPRAPLVTPSTCGTFSTASDLMAWSAPESGPDALSSDPFTIDSGCAIGFSPAFVAGTVSNQAGSFSPFVLSFSRTDSDQQVKGLTFTMPPGVSAVLKGVPECADADANAGTCPEAARIGEVTVGSGAGPDPYFLKGTVYFTGPYNGGPFGEVTVVPAVAGPFNLGNVVVRGSIRVDPSTGQATVVSDPFPQMVGQTGIPTDVRRVDVIVDRPGFTFNPTNCDPLTVAGTLTSVQGASANVSSPFQVTNCALLAFKPKFTASTQGSTSRADGASLDVKVGFAAGQANVAKVRVSLPKALPSRLDTLKLACPDKAFAADPGTCPAASRVGTAVAKTPILASAITGPAYLVSHGGAAFPDLEIVLQGEGVTLVLDGHTDIKNNITTSTFDTVPDVPVTDFELQLPEGAHSVLGAPGGNLCGKTLTMPTTLTAQNGAVLQQSTRIAVTGCKPALRVLRHSVSGASATVTVGVPLAGRLSASGAVIAPVRRRVAGPGEVTVELALTQAERRFLATHPGRRARVRVRLALAGAHGARLRSSVTLLLG